MIKDYYVDVTGKAPIKSVWGDSKGIHIDFPDVTVHMSHEDYDEFMNILGTVYTVVVHERTIAAASNEPVSETTPTESTPN